MVLGHLPASLAPNLRIASGVRRTRCWVACYRAYRCLSLDAHIAHALTLHLSWRETNGRLISSNFFDPGYAQWRF